MEVFLKSILENVLLLIAVLAASGVAYFIKQNIDKEIVEKKKDLVAIAVNFAEQAYKGYDGERKYIEAVTWLKNELNKKGLTYTDNELKGLIESTLLSFKNELMKKW